MFVTIGFKNLNGSVSAPDPHHNRNEGRSACSRHHIWDSPRIQANQIVLRSRVSLEWHVWHSRRLLSISASMFGFSVFRIYLYFFPYLPSKHAEIARVEMHFCAGSVGRPVRFTNTGGRPHPAPSGGGASDALGM